MKRSMVVMAAVAAFGSTACQTGREPQELEADQPAPDTPQVALDEEPLLLDDEPLLLLDDSPSVDEAGADNSRCHVCHMNYFQEDIAVIHARAKIGCADCHGESDAHIADESWASGGNGTPPDVMYTPEKVNTFCMGCHPKNTIAGPQHTAVFAGKPEENRCTDCHGEHRLAHRVCTWK